jgi:hypothetical protein
MVRSLAALLSTSAAAALAVRLLTPAESDLVAGCHGWCWLLQSKLRLALYGGLDWGGKVGEERRRGEKGKGRTGCCEAMVSVAAVMGSGAWICCSTTEGIYSTFVSFHPSFPFLLVIAVDRHTLIDSSDLCVCFILVCSFGVR